MLRTTLQNVKAGELVGRRNVEDLFAWMTRCDRRNKRDQTAKAGLDLVGANKGESTGNGPVVVGR